MARTQEGKVKDRVSSILRQYGAYYFYPTTAGFGRSGVPDIVACYNGIFIGIECKADKGKVTELQYRELRKIQEACGMAIIVYGYDTTSLEVLLEMLKQEVDE